MTLKETLFQKLDEKKDRIIEIRRYLHEYPELSFEETKTAQYIADFYKDLDCNVRTHVGGNGVVVTIDSGKSGRTLAIRADFDALPITEDTDLPFASKTPGVMHACGHDGHTAYMLILAETLIELKDQLTGKIVILHQHAEEQAPGGALPMIKDGALDGVDNVIGIHVMSTMKTGDVFYREGAIQTGRSGFTLKIQGAGGHGSSPHLANDAIVAGSEFVFALQTVVSRRLDPFKVGSVTIGSFDGKGLNNVIKDSVVLKGDVRVMEQSTRDLIEKEIKRIVAGLEAMFGVTCDLDYDNNYPVLVNDDRLTEFVAKSLKNSHIKEINDVIRCDPQQPSEDFAYYAQERPSVFFYVGAMPKDGTFHPHHIPKFMINEDCLLIAAKSMAAVVMDYFADYKDN